LLDKEEKVREILYNNKIYRPDEIDVYKIARSMKLEFREALEYP
jgi:hypothetical protein